MHGTKSKGGLISLLLPLACLGAPAQAQDQQWIRQIGTREVEQATGLALDGTGGIFTGGYTVGDLGGPNAGAWDAWLARYDGSGNQVWIRQFGTSEEDAISHLHADDAGGVYIAGRTLGELGGPNAGINDAWIARCDSSGERLWTRQFGTTGNDYANAVTTDGADGAFVAGTTGGSLGGPSAGYNDAWLARYDGAGNRIWIRQLGTNENDGASGLAPDGAGGVFVAGTTLGSLGATHAGHYDVWLARYDGAGSRLWLRQFGTAENDQPSARLAADSAGGVYIGGFSQGDLAAPNAGDLDAWLARYDSAGNRIWMRQFGTPDDDQASGLGVSASGGVYATGRTSGSLGSQNSGWSDVWIASFDDAGVEVWLDQFGTGATESPLGLVSDGVAGFFIGGATRGSLGGRLAGQEDAWFARYADACPADIDGDGDADVNDFFAYLDLFAAGDPRADIDGDGDVDVNDFFAYLDLFAAGC